jgi:hypothetical protein
VGWQPNGNVEPLDLNAVNDFYAMGPQPQDLIRSAYTDNGVRLPVTYWAAKPGSSPTQWTLTGLGMNKPPVST